MTSNKLFVSYKHEPEVVKFVTKLTSDLEERGFTVWRDVKNIRAGDKWLASIGMLFYHDARIVALLWKC